LYQGTTSQLAKKAAVSIQIPKNTPQGLKPRIDSIGIAPGMNPRPTARIEFFSKLFSRAEKARDALGL
jgi:hypothetical protein